MKRTTESQLLHDKKRKEKLMKRTIKERAPRAKSLRLDDLNVTKEQVVKMGYEGPDDETLMAGFYVMNDMHFSNHKKFPTYYADWEGNVYHITRCGRVVKIKPVFLNVDNKTYMVLNVKNKYINAYTMTLHKFVYEAISKKEVLPYQDIHHKDFNPLNNCYFNLMTMDESEHMAIHGSFNKGKKYSRKSI